MSADTHPVLPLRPMERPTLTASCQSCSLGEAGAPGKPPAQDKPRGTGSCPVLLLTAHIAPLANCQGMCPWGTHGGGVPWEAVSPCWVSVPPQESGATWPWPACNSSSNHGPSVATDGQGPATQARPVPGTHPGREAPGCRARRVRLQSPAGAQNHLCDDPAGQGKGSGQHCPG